MDASGETCPGCSSMYTGACNLARIIPGCSHNLCEKCILTDGTNTGQVACRSPGCSTSTPWTNRPDQFVPNMLILGIVTYRQLCLSQALVPGNNVDVLENVNHEIVDVTGGSQPQDDKCDIVCGECEESTADCLCQTCHSCLCSNCFHKIHKMAKSLMSHKSLPIVTDCDGQKMEEKVKLSNCTHHGKKIEYVAEGGEVGCAQCVIFGNLKGLDATTIVSYNKNIKKDLREKIDEGKSKIERLKSVLSGLKEERAIKEDISSEDLTKEIQCHFSECHSQLQTLQHHLCQKLQKHQIELSAWQRNIDVLIKSTASKIEEATNILQFSEEAVSNDAVLDTFNFNEILSLLAVLDDEASEDIEQTKPNSCTLAIEPGFKHHLMNHITLNKSDASSVSHPAGASSPLASSTFLAPDYSVRSPPPSPVVSSTIMAFEFSESSPPPQMASFVSESELITPYPPETSLIVTGEMGHQDLSIILQNEVLQTEDLQQKINRHEKVSEQEVLRLENVSQQEVHQPENVFVTKCTTAGEQCIPLRTPALEPSPAAPSVFTALDSTGSYSTSEMASLVLESELPSSPREPFLPTTPVTVADEFCPIRTFVAEPSIVRSLDSTRSSPPPHMLDSTGNSPPPHMASIVPESEPPPSPPSPKVCHQQLQQLEKVSQLEIQQPDAVQQQEIQQPLQVCQQQLQQQQKQHLSASSTSSLEHPRPTAKTVCISYQDGNKSTLCKSVSKKEKHRKSPRGRDSGVLSKSSSVNLRRNLIEKNLQQRKISKVKEGESRESSPPDWNSVLKKSILKIKAQKQAPNLKRIYQQVTRDHRNLKPISDDIVEKKLDEAVEKGVLERIVKDEKVTFQITRRPRYKVARKLWSTPSASPLDSPLRSDINEGAGLNVSALWKLDSDDFGAMVGLQENVNV